MEQCWRWFGPGYSYVGILEGLAQLRGVIRTLEWQGYSQ